MLFAFCLGAIPVELVHAQRQGNDRLSNDDGKSEFYRGYYLQNEAHNYEAALAAYRAALDAGANADLREHIQDQISRIESELAASDFAALMPASAFAYVEITSPADHVERVAEMMGLTGNRETDGEVVTIQLDEALAISSDFKISPALMREMKKVRGAAAAITSFDPRTGPDGIAIIHPGDSDLLTGMLETGVQLVPTTENINGYPTYQIENEVWIVKTERLIVVARNRTAIESCIGRIGRTSDSSLADQPAFQQARDAAGDSAVFAYASPAGVMNNLDDRMLREISIARMLMDLDHLNSVSASLGSTSDGIRFQARARYAENHNSLAYGLIRTAPLSGEALAYVPAESMAVIGLGVNPQLLQSVPAGDSNLISAMDIGREIFGNIREIGLFVLPQMTDQSNEVPETAMLIVSNDADKSERLWDQLLTLPSQVIPEEGLSASDVQIEGVAARRFTFPERDAPHLFVARLNENCLIAGTNKAVAAAISAANSGNTLANSPQGASLGRAMDPETTSKVAMVHIGRAMRLAASVNRGDSREMLHIADAIGELHSSMVINEGANEMEISVELTALPQFEDIIRTASRMMPENYGIAGRDRIYAEQVVESYEQPSLSDEAADAGFNEEE